MSSARTTIGLGLSILLLLASACSRDAEPVAGSSDALKWARDALARNTSIEVVAVDPAGIFTVRDRATGELTMVRVQDLVAAPAAAPVAAAASAPVVTPVTEHVPTAVAATTDPGTDEIVYAEPEPAPEYVVTRDAGRVTIVGKGVTIASAEAANTATGEGPAASGATSSIAGTPAAGRERIEQRGGEPIVCQGARSMRIDDREIHFSGDGLIVEDGCQLYLTNSRIEAGGVAIIVTRGDVHIVNSTVSGAGGAIDASLGARVFLSSASIDGLQRRFDTAQINDLGNNRWR